MELEVHPIPPEAPSLGAVFDELNKLGCKVEPCGSRVTCFPAPKDTDEDYLVEVPADSSPVIAKGQDKIALVVSLLNDSGFHWEGGKHYQIQIAGDFMSFRRDDVNLIVTGNEKFANQHRLATYVCKRLNILNKLHRITVFQALLYGNKWDPIAALDSSSIDAI